MKHAAFGLAAMLVAGCAATPPPATTANDGVRLYALDCGAFELQNTAMFSPNHEYDGKPGNLSDPCFLIRHPKGDLVWDAGIPPSMATPEGQASATRTIRTVTLPEQLAELGLTPADIEYFSISHSHYDHIGEANLFAGSTWIVDKDERDWMFRDAMRTQPAFAFYSQLENAPTQLIENGEDYDVFGDGTVTMIAAHGHTPGHRVLLLKLKHAGAVLIAGDMWHLAEAQKLRTVPALNTDKEETLRSMDKVEVLARDNNARLVRQHVPEDVAALPAFPAALD
ncbi:MAG: N-acyl homoserine lactonase family protein [Hyphomonadaceae bacterium]